MPPFVSRKSKRNSAPDDIPIRLAVTFAPSRARVMAGLHGAAVYARLVYTSVRDTQGQKF
jgi:hypothetical protein